MVCLNKECEDRLSSNWCDVEICDIRINLKKTNREELIKKIENNDPQILGELADLILDQRGAPKLKEIKCTTATLNKIIRDKVGK